ncbi:MAG: hypothetical protein OZ921_03135 [Sorangiineae bacterium]|nr:hypothetical protein [Polyangiaceae bacterium]MEB2321483.1 hypothetical protein [Sorangiineae bacterium]
MQLSRPIQLRQPPPLWFVSNGETTVGPVRTDLLLRGVFHGRVPDDCWVRELTWGSWRALGEIREVAALRRAQGFGGGVQNALERPGVKAAGLIRHGRDTGEVLLFALHAAVAATGAEVGFAHRLASPWESPITRAAHGDGTHGLLGARIAPSDLALGAARARRIVLGAPDSTGVHRAVAARLTGGVRELSGVAMLPILRERELLAFIELGRRGHGFRRHDVDALELVGQVAVEQIERAPS